MEGAAGVGSAERWNVTSARAWIIGASSEKVTIPADTSPQARHRTTPGMSPATLHPDARLSRISVTSHRDVLQPGHIAAIVADVESDRRAPRGLGGEPTSLYYASGEA